MRLASKFSKIALITVGLGLLVAALGVGYQIAYRFHGHFRLTEGEAVLEANKSYLDLRTSWVRPNPEFQWGVQLEQVSLRYSPSGEIAEVAAGLFFFDQHETKGYQGVAGLTHPVKVGGLQLCPVSIGVTPALDVFDADGELIWRGAPKMDILDKQAQKKGLFTVKEQEYLVSFYPASRIVGGQLVNASLTPTNPVFVFQIPDEGISQPVQVGGDPVPVGQYTIQVPGYRYWLEFEVTSPAGLKLIYIGLTIVAFGLVATVITGRSRKARGLSA